MMLKVKVCCIKSIHEARMALSFGANFIGLVGPMPSGPGTLTVDQIKDIKVQLSPRIECFYLTSKTSIKDILMEYEQIKTTHIQLTDHVEESVRQTFKKAYPNTAIVQVVHVTDESSIELAKSYSQNSDYLLLDSGTPTNKIKELGGTGKKHNWEISKQIVKTVDIPVFLAGGINYKNVEEAAAIVKPYGIDLCSSLRTSDNLDRLKTKQFFESLKRIEMI